MSELRTEILISGGGVGGCAAALAAAEMGRRVILTEESDWIGGQLTSQAVPPDEHGWIERFGCTASYRRYRDQVRDFYRRNFPLTDEARGRKLLNPGNGWVSPLCHEPRVALAVLESMLAPFVNSGRITILREHKPVAADVANDRIRSVTARDMKTGKELTIHADYFIDATELGDLEPITGAEFVTGYESRRMTGEPSAPEEARPGDIQAFSVCFALDYLEGEDHTIQRPDRYQFWREFTPRLSPSWPGRLLSLTITHPRLMTPHTYHFAPHREPAKAFAGLWSYRRILDRSQFAPGAFASDICLVNWPQTDYLLGDILNCGEEERARHIAEARQQSLSLVFWLQTEAPRPDGGQGWKGLRLRGDVTGSRAGDHDLAKMPYIRESRRIKADFTVVEQHVAAALRPGETRAERYKDSVGIGYYRIDLHPSTIGEATIGEATIGEATIGRATIGEGVGSNYIDVESLPFQIPLGAMIPIRIENLLPACKNIGVTHITNGCYRLHPVEWNIGEVAGALASYCVEKGAPPRSVSRAPEKLEDFQRLLIRRGVELEWPENLALEEGDPHIHAR